MAKNEAKIKFTAETGEFNKALKKSNEELAELRAELKLNETQMDNNGKSIENLEKKHSILEDQLKASQAKTEALTNKVEKAVEIFGENSTEVSKLRTQLMNAQTAEEKIRRSIANCNAEIEEQADSAREAETKLGKLTSTIDEQQSEVNRLKEEYVEAVIEYGRTSTEVKDLAKQIQKLSTELKKNKTQLDSASNKADDLDRSMDDAGNSARDSAGDFGAAAVAIGNLAADAIGQAVAKLGEFIGYLAELPEATREFRQNMATLEVSFDTAGFSMEQATELWQGLYGVFGDDARAVEAANLISKMCDDQEDLNKWLTITTGVYGQFQDSLPVEGLAEASNETAKTGQVTGVLADALNWSSEAAEMFAGYMSDEVTTAEDAFNEALKECSTEQERQALITETLTALYGDSAAKYEEVAGSQMEAKEASAELALAEAEMAEAVEPLTTAWDGFKAEIMTAVTPALETVCGWLQNVVGWLKENPAVMYTVIGILGALAAAVTVLGIAFMVSLVPSLWATATGWMALNVPIIATVAAIMAVIAVIVLCIMYWDEICAAASAAWDWIVGVFSGAANWLYNHVVKPVADFFVGLWDGICDGVSAAWNWISELCSSIATWIYDSVIKPVADFFVGLWNGIVNAWHTVIDPWVEIVKRLASIFYNDIIKPIANFFTGLWNGIVNGLRNAWNWICNLCSTVANWINNTVIKPISNLFTNLWNGIKNIFSTVKDWFNNTVIKPVVNLFKGIWNTIVNGAKSAWNGIKKVFSAVVGFFRDIFSNAWNAVKNVFSVGGKIFDGIKDGIVTAFKTVVNAIIKGINKVVALPFQGLNGVLDTIAGVSIVGIQPFSWLTWRCPVPQIPLLAEGGILTKPTLNIAGEAGAEAVIPLDRLQSFVSNAVDRSLQAVNLHALADAIEDLANRPIEMNINGRQFALATAGDSDSVNGLRNTFSGRGLILD